MWHCAVYILCAYLVEIASHRFRVARVRAGIAFSDPYGHTIDRAHIYPKAYSRATGVQLSSHKLNAFLQIHGRVYVYIFPRTGLVQKCKSTELYKSPPMYTWRACADSHCSSSIVFQSPTPRAPKDDMKRRQRGALHHRRPRELVPAPSSCHGRRGLVAHIRPRVLR